MLSLSSDMQITIRNPYQNQLHVTMARSTILTKKASCFPLKYKCRLHLEHPAPLSHFSFPASEAEQITLYSCDEISPFRDGAPWRVQAIAALYKTYKQLSASRSLGEPREPVTTAKAMFLRYELLWLAAKKIWICASSMCEEIVSDCWNRVPAYLLPGLSLCFHVHLPDML